MMTQSEFEPIESWIRAYNTNITRCREVIKRSAALVEQTKKLIEICQKTLQQKEATALNSVKLSRQAARESQRLLAVETTELRHLAECSRVGSLATKAPLT